MDNNGLGEMISHEELHQEEGTKLLFNCAQGLREKFAHISAYWCHKDANGQGTNRLLRWIHQVAHDGAYNIIRLAFLLSLVSHLTINFIDIIFYALLYAVQQALIPNVIANALEDLLIDMPGIRGALVRAYSHEYPA